MAGASPDRAHRRMTGSALRGIELRGTFRMRLLRALSGIEGEFEGERVAGSSSDRVPSADLFLMLKPRFINEFPC